MGIKTVPHPPYSPDFAPCDFWLFPYLRGCPYVTTEETNEAVMKIIDMLTKEDFDGAFEKLLEQYNKCIAAKGDYFEGRGQEFHVCTINKSAHMKKNSGNLFNDPHVYIYIYKGLKKCELCVLLCSVCINIRYSLTKCSRGILMV